MNGLALFYVVGCIISGSILFWMEKTNSGRKWLREFKGDDLEEENE